MKVEIKYDIGQTVWTIRLSCGEDKRIICPLCEGAKDLFAFVKKEGQAETVEKKIRCPRCNGVGQVRVWPDKYVVRKQKVVSVRYEKNSADYEFVSYKLTPEEEEFANDESFVEDSIFSTEEEAQAEADACNKSMGW